MKFAMTLRALDKREHPVELADIARAFDVVGPLIRAGATGGINALNVPHSHMGESDNARYEITWQVVKNA